ncbi:hypothetical protein F1880_000684 [Penicillium rolfsii]|nr:hypothetical protein F1880_000684 [Penicillium rolfsii]
MFSYSELSAGTSILEQQIEEQVLQLADQEPLSAKEQAESDRTREQTLASLRRTIEMLEGPMDQPEQQMAQIRDDWIANEQAALSISEEIPFPSMDVQPGDHRQAVTNVSKGMSGGPGSAIKAQATKLTKMTAEIEKIMPRFSAILDQPYLKKYDSSLNKVPILGIKGDQIFYIKTSSANFGLGTVDSWALFGDKPENANLTSSKANHFFPYHGDLCFAVGKSIWRKKHRSEHDPKIKDAVNHWPALYEERWEPLGDQCLPDANLLSIISYAVFFLIFYKIKFQLLILTKEGQIMLLKNDHLGGDNQFQAMTSTSNEAVTWKKIAYFNDKVVGLDSNNCTWNLTMDFDNYRYKAEDRFQVDAFSEFTATDVGPVGVGEDGFLYKRIVEITNETQEASQGKLKWNKWIEQFGVTSIGVASPGVRLDLHELTRTLESRYVETQKALYPIVQKIQTFGITHNVHAQQLREVAKQYEDANTDEKEAIAVKQGKTFVKHTKVWAKVLTRQTRMCRESVVGMHKEIGNVRSDLASQKMILIDQLKRVESQLKNLREDYKKINAWFWAAVATAVVGLGLTILLACTGVGLLGCCLAGALFVAGLVAACSLGEQRNKIAEAIVNSESERDRLKTAIEEITYVVDSFKELEDLTGTLNEFWGGMLNNAMMLETMDKATAQMLGEEALSSASIEASYQTTEELIKGSASYLAVLNRIGIKLDEEPEDMPSAAMLPAVANGEQENKPSAPAETFETLAVQAQNALESSDFEKYEETMEAANFIDLGRMMVDMKGVVMEGNWVNLRLLGESISAIGFAETRYNQYAPLVEVKTTLRNGRQQMIDMMIEVQQFSAIGQEWTRQIPDFPTTPVEVTIAQHFQNEAIKNCQKARNRTAQANNLFLEVSRRVKDMGHEIRMQIAEASDRMRAQMASIDSQLENLKSNPFRYLFDPSSLMDLVTRKEFVLQETKMQIHFLEEALNVSHTLGGQLETWQQFCESIHGNLGSMHNILTGLRIWLEEDPSEYRQLITTSWTNIASQSKRVVELLALTEATPEYAPQAAIMESQAALTLGSGNPELLAVLLPEATLNASIKGYTEDAKIAIDSIDQLQTLPWIHDIVAYWDPSAKKQITLGGNILALRSAYAELVRTEYLTILDLNSLSVIQMHHGARASSAPLKLKNVLRASGIFLKKTHKSATLGQRRLKQHATELSGALQATKSTMAEIVKQIAAARKALAIKDKEHRDRVRGIIIHAGLLGFASGALVASIILGFQALGASAVSTGGTSLAALVATVSSDDEKPEDDEPEGGEEEEEEKGETQVDEKGAGKTEETKKTKQLKEGFKQAQKKWSEFNSIRAAVKDVAVSTELGRSIFGDMPIAALVTTLVALESAVGTMESAIKIMESAHSALQRLFHWEEKITSSLQIMVTKYEALSMKEQESGQLAALSSEDGKALESAWNEVSASAEGWLSFVNRQGISFDVDDDAFA